MFAEPKRSESHRQLPRSSLLQQRNERTESIDENGAAQGDLLNPLGVAYHKRYPKQDPNKDSLSLTESDDVGERKPKRYQKSRGMLIPQPRVYQPRETLLTATSFAES